MPDELAEATRLRQQAQARFDQAGALLAAAIRHERACQEQATFRHEHPAYREQT